MGTPIRVLIVEDSEDDTLLLVRELKRGGYDPTFERIDKPEAMAAVLERQTWDIVIADYVMPRFSGLDALKLLQKRGLDIPFIIVSGSIGEDTAVAAMKAGANDYLMKNKLTRLVPAIEQELRDAEVRRKLNQSENERRLVEEALQKNEERFRLAAESSTDLIYEWDIKERVDWFGKIDEMLGYAPGEFPRTFEAWANSVHPDDRDRVKAAVKNHLEKNEPYDIEYRVRKKDGTYNYWWARGTAVRDEKGNPRRWVGAVTDIAERKRAENALRESEDRYRDLVENSQDIICTHDLKGYLLSVNPAMVKLLGYERNTLLSMNVHDILAPEVRDQFSSYLDTIRRDGAAKGLVLVQTATGERRIWEYNNTVRTEGVASPIVRVINRDVTERKRAEELLRESEGKYRTILETMEEGYYEVDLKGNFTFFNDSLCRMLGYTKDELMGMNNRQYMDKETERKVYQVFNQLYTNGESYKTFDWEIIRKDHTKRFHESSVSLIRNAKGEKIGFRGIVRDITDRKRAEEALLESEERFRDLFDNAPTGYFEYDIQGRITNVNRTELEMLGYTLEEMMGQPVWKFVVEEEIARKMVLAKLAGTMPPSRGLERTYQRKDGTTFPSLVQDRLLRDAEGKIVGIRGTVQDITERKKSEQEMVSLQEQLRQSQKMEAIGQLAGGIAHDFNNLLTVIQGNCQLALMDLRKEDPLRKNIGEVNEASEKAAELTRQLLAFSRKQILEMKVLDLNLILQRLDKMLHRLLGEDIQLVTILTEGIGKVKADPGQIEQVIVNLAVNSRDAMPEGGELTIETADVELDEEYADRHIGVQPGRYVMLSVSDTGMGMTPEVGEKVFEPFFTTKEKGKGTGLGLSTVYGIVKQSGGNIWVYSEQGQGTIFKVYLPRVDEPLTELKEEVSKEIQRGNETVLLVEDEETVRKLAMRMLKGLGYRILEAPEGGTALLLCEEFKEPIHLILTDVVMPGMSGRKLVDRLKEIHPEMKVLYMSGYTDNAIVHHGILEEGTNFIHKPFTLHGLARKVRGALDKA